MVACTFFFLVVYWKTTHSTAKLVTINIINSSEVIYLPNCLTMVYTIQPVYN